MPSYSSVSSPRKNEEEVVVSAQPTVSFPTASLLPRLVADETQLKDALQAFQYAHSSRLSSHWAYRYHLYFIDAGIDSMNALLAGCKEDTINLDLDFIGVSPNDRIDAETIQYLINFLPGPVGIRCFRLAQMAAEKVRRGEADVKYVHRPENGNAGNELWHVIPHSRHSSPLSSRQNSFAMGLSSPTSSHNTSSLINQILAKELLDETPPQWKLHVDCAGFVRSVLKHITKDVVQVSLSDRSFMRAKDFYRFFETLDRTVTDREPLPMEAQTERIKKWRVITDLRMVIPGDIIVYRPKGNAAGGAAFTTNDRSDLKHLLKAVKMALLYKEEMDQNGPKHLVTRNLGRDPAIKPFIQSNREKLHDIGIKTCSQLREKMDHLNTLLMEKGYEPYDEFCIQLFKECSETNAKNTGHIVFASGSPVLMGNGDYRVKVVHSTKNGVNQTQGVQQYYRRFQLRDGPNGPKWTRIAPAKIPNRGKLNNDDVDDDEKNDPSKIHSIEILEPSNVEKGESLPPTATGESSQEKPNMTTTTETPDEDGDDNVDDEDVDVDDPDDPPDSNGDNDSDGPEKDDGFISNHPCDTNNNSTGSSKDDTGLLFIEDTMTDDITNDELGGSCRSVESVRIFSKGVVGHDDELAGLVDVEVLAARMCF